MKHVEKELKILITEGMYRNLCQLAKGQGGLTVNQINHYFDTPDLFMYRNRMALRIREKNKQYVLTLKVGKNKEEEYQTSHEYNYPIEQEQATKTMDGKLSPLSLIPDTSVKNILPKDRPLIYMG